LGGTTWQCSVQCCGADDHRNRQWGIIASMLSYLVASPRLRHEDEHPRFLGALESAPSLLPCLVIYPTASKKTGGGQHLMRCHWDRHLVVLPGGVVALFTCQRRRLAAPSVRCACGYHLLMAQASVSRSWCLLSPGDPDAAPGASDFNASGIGMVGMERSELPAVTNFHIKQPRRGHVNHCVEGGTAEQHKKSLQKNIQSPLGPGRRE
jgi:hypothetical protein